MNEVILNDECMHCKTKECHDGEHFCNQAMKENSFYKNAKLYKGLEVIQRPTYEELEKENTELKKKKEEIEIMTNFCKACKKMHTDNLTKAKEIIKGLLSFVDSLGNYSGGIFAKAEQFLKGEADESKN